MDADALMRANMQLSDRHREWGDDCPMVDLDFLMCEYNHGIPVAIVDYKFHGAEITQTSVRTYETLSGFYDEDHHQVPFFIARYWPDVWAFKVKPINEAASAFFERVKPGLLAASGAWVSMTEQQFVWLLYRLRKDALDIRDQRYLERLHQVIPPAEAVAS
jgi:hypothetical protein